MPLTIAQLRCRFAAAVLSSLIVLLLFGSNVICAQTTSAKLDQFGNVNAEDAMARLDGFALELQSHSDALLSRTPPCGPEVDWSATVLGCRLEFEMPRVQARTLALQSRQPSSETANCERRNRDASD